MNDLDLLAALQRDAELAGEPSPDLLEQLGRRRDRQRHQRLGVAAAVLGVVLIAGGIPLGQSLLDRPDGRTADTPPAVTSGSAASSSTPPAPSSTSAAPVLPAPPGCPDAAALLGLMAPPTGGDTAPQLGAPTATCSGDWAVIGVRYGTAQSIALFQFAAGSWREVDRSDACAAGDVPADLVAGVCNAG